MIAQRPRDAAPAVRGAAEALPFVDGAFDAAMAILTVHHWTDAAAGFAELRRVARRHVVVTWDPELVRGYWLVADYVPGMGEHEAHLLTLDGVLRFLPSATVIPLPVPADCSDGFMAAYWARPEAYLDASVRAAISGLALLDQATVADAMQRLAGDLDTGRWDVAHPGLRKRTELEVGYRLVVADAS
jgi:SAM-dependent methyltransferase